MDAIAAVDAVLEEIGAGDTPRLLVLNKVDLLDEEERRELSLRHPDAVLVSAVTGRGARRAAGRIADSIEAVDSPRSSCSYPLTPVSGSRSSTRSLVTSSARIARTGFSFARDFLPPSPIASPTLRSTGAERDPVTEFAPPATESATRGGTAVGRWRSPTGATSRAMRIGGAAGSSSSARRRRCRPGRTTTTPASTSTPPSPPAWRPGARVSVGTGLAVADPGGPRRAGAAALRAGAQARRHAGQLARA